MAEDGEKVLVSSGPTFEEVSTSHGKCAPHAGIPAKHLDSVLKQMLLRSTLLAPQSTIDEALREGAGWLFERHYIATFLAPASLIKERKSKANFEWFSQRGIALDDSWFRVPGIYAMPSGSSLGIIRLPDPRGMKPETLCAVVLRHTKCVFVPIGVNHANDDAKG